MLFVVVPACTNFVFKFFFALDEYHRPHYNLLRCDLVIEPDQPTGSRVTAKLCVVVVAVVSIFSND